VPLTLVRANATFRKSLDDERAEGRLVGLVPTMGALHAGHASLINRAVADCDVVAVTVYVNPLQFSASEDLASYPRDLENDLAAAEDAGAGYVFAPSVEEMFPRSPRTMVSVGDVTTALEGASRPGHFAGVATIVTKILSLTGPCRAYFGEKDYQQLVVIRSLVADLSIPVDVVGCPTVREEDGLALSSRNAYLDEAERTVAPTLYRALLAGRQAIQDEGARDPGAVRQRMLAVIGAAPLVELDYAEVVAADDLRALEVLEGEVRLLGAVRLGRTRLIDNLGAVA
jgi:pantoate--beta-alanine ligase